MDEPESSSDPHRSLSFTSCKTRYNVANLRWIRRRNDRAALVDTGGWSFSGGVQSEESGRYRRERNR